MELERARGDYVKPKYLPKEVALKQYYHLRQKDVSAILEHWTGRQAAGKVPFLFRKAVRAIPENNRTLDENGASEEDLQDDEGSQARVGGPPQGDASTHCPTQQVHPGHSPGDAAEDPNRVSWLLKHGK